MFASLQPLVGSETPQSVSYSLNQSAVTGYLSMSLKDNKIDRNIIWCEWL